MVPTSTIITVWAPAAMNYIWDSVTGFFWSSGVNGHQFVLVIIVLFSIVAIVISAVKFIFSPNKKNFPIY